MTRVIDGDDCTGCIYARPIIIDGDAGEELLSKCVRFPPQIYLDGDGDTCQGFPDTQWRCGEYKTNEN